MSDQALVVLAPHPREGIDGNPATCIGAGQPAVFTRGKWVCSSCGIPTVVGPRWTKENYAEYLKTDIWKERADSARSRANGRCWTCNFKGALEVHHRTYDNVGRESPDDLVALCSPCHTAIHLVADQRRGITRSESKRAQWAG